MHGEDKEEEMVNHQQAAYSGQFPVVASRFIQSGRVWRTACFM
jgi:hypothetical protein